MMNKNAKKLLVLTAALTTVFAFTGCGSQSAETKTETTSEAAPETKTETASDDAAVSENGGDLFKNLKTVDLNGNEVDSSVFAKNKVTLVNTWSTGCTPCVQELPFLGKLNREYADKGAAVMGLYIADPDTLPEQERKDIEELTAKAEADYTQLMTTPEMFENDIIKNLQVYPTTYLVDSEGNIMETLEGSNDYEGWKEIIDSALEKAGANE